MNAGMNETLNVSGALLVKLFGKEAREKERFATHASEVRDIGVASAVVSQWFFLAIGLIAAIGTAVVYWVGGNLVLAGTFTVGTIVAFGAYLSQLYGPLMSLTNVPVEFAQSMVSFERVFEALDIPQEVKDKANAKTIGRAKGRIEFQSVSFSYQVGGRQGSTSLSEVARIGWDGDRTALLKRGLARSVETGDAADQAPAEAQERWALRDVSFTVEPGQLVALVGPSGAGKSTMTYMLPRLYDPTDGAIFLDGSDLRDLTLASLVANIGMVTQDTFLFYDTIRANLLYARDDATEAEMFAAAKAANIHDFVLSLPEGYETVVGERGYRLSGGERQRIAIARVLLKDPQILVMDEATSHLDSLSESLIQEALQTVMRGRTSIVIAHRLSTVLSADRILIMDAGRIVESGSHLELVDRGGLYSALYETQFRALGGEKQEGEKELTEIG
jgi:ATP-binding cassette subfamily B protein